jgi:hypothetical protein
MKVRAGQKIELLASRMAVQFEPAGDYIPISAWFSIDASDDVLILLDHYQASRKGLFTNLLRASVDGVVIWIAQAPGSRKDSFVEVRLEGETLVANTWDCFACNVDLSNGSVSKAALTK